MASKSVIIKPPNQSPARVPTPLVYNDSIDTTNMTNIMLIDSNVLNNKQFYDSANTNTFPIIYNYNSSTEDLIALLRKKFSASSIQRISLVFHDKGVACIVPFMNNKLLFEKDDLIEKQTSFTMNVSFLISCIKEFHVVNIDFLACNTLQYSNWKSYYALLASRTSVVVGASNDATGNVQYGGNWVMESTKQDIKQIYFSNNIDYYKYLLADYTLNGVQYTFTSPTTASVTGFDAGITTANIPNTIFVSPDTYNVTSIGNNAFFFATTLTSVTIPNSVTTIGDYAFFACEALTSVAIPNSVTDIGISAFSNCIRLTSVAISSSVTSIGSGAFKICLALTAIAVDASNPNYSSDAFGVLFNKLQTDLIQYPAGNTQTSYTIPSSVTSIGNTSFFYCQRLTSVIIPISVITIGNEAFRDCSALSSVTIPSFVTSIGAQAFTDCTLLASVTIPSSVTTIGSAAFSGCLALTSVAIPSSVTSIGSGAFSGCLALTAIAVDASNPNYSSDAFGVLFNKLQTDLIQYPAGNTQTSYTIPSSVTSIGDNAFLDCRKLTSIVIPNSVTTIGTSAFSGCISLTSVTLPTNALFTSIGDNVFNGCDALTSIVIPNSVTSIGSGAFYFCERLTSVTISNSVTSIQYGAFSACIALTYVFIPNSVTSIGDFAFAECNKLAYVTIGNSVTNIEANAFKNCIRLTSVFIPNSVTSIGDSAFQGCSILNLVYFLQTSALPTIGVDAFSNNAVPSVGKYYSSVSDTSSIAPPVFTSISPISNTPPTLTSVTPLSGSAISYGNLAINGNEAGGNPPYDFLVNSITSGSLLIEGTPWDATTNKTINPGDNAYWTPPVGSIGLLNAFSVVVQDALGEVSSPNVQVQVNIPVNLVVDGSTESIYFRMSGSVIQYSIGTLTSPGSWTSIPSNSWPIQIANSNSASVLRVAATQNLMISNTYGNTSGYLEANSENITFDGSGNTITMNNIANYPGFIKNYNGISYANIVVQNFTTNAIGSSTLASFAGWLCQRNFGTGVLGNQIISCTNMGNFNVLLQENSGGIAGAEAGAGGGASISFINCTNSGIGCSGGGGIAGSGTGNGGGSATFTNCTNSGTIGLQAGGIVGINSASIGSTITFTNCSNSGTIAGGGGIAGNNVGWNGSSATFTNCSNSGNIDAGGGIVATDAGVSSGLVTITNCRNSGKLSVNGYGTGGIFSGYSIPAQGSVVIITNCINTGQINGSKAGGIVGTSAGYTPTPDSNITVTRCINTGEIGGSGSGGIVGSDFACNTTNTCSITNCYNIGNLIGIWCGGITGAGVGYTNNVLYLPKIVNISNCYSLGSIGPSCGGICGGRSGSGAYTGTPTINITNCYSYGVLTNAGSGIVSTALPIPTNQNNIYVANGNWRDASANAIGALTGTPISLTTGNPGATWTKMANNYPYLLSTFNAQLYSPNNASSASNYTTNVGLFTDPSYNYQIINNNQSGNVASTLVFVAKGTIPYYYSYNINTFQFTNSGTSTDIITATITPSSGILNYELSPICFKKGSKILCENDIYRSVEELKIGDLVKTYKHGYQKVIMSAHSTLSNDSQNRINQLYTYSREKNPDLIEDLHLTCGHSLLLDTLTDEESARMKEINWPEDDFIVEDKYKLLACFSSQLYVAKEQNVEIYHFTLEPPENAKPSYVYGIYANGILAESCSQGAMETISGKRIMICESNTPA